MFFFVGVCGVWILHKKNKSNVDVELLLLLLLLRLLAIRSLLQIEE